MWLDMAQRPWEVLRERSLALPEASRFLRKARNDLLSSIFIPHRSENVRKTSKAAAAAAKSSRPPCSDLILSTLQNICWKLEDKRLTQTKSSDGDSILSPGVFRKCHIRGLAQLWPMYISYPAYGTMQYLNDNFTLKYVPELNGVVLAFRKISCASDPGIEAFSYESEPSGVVVFNFGIEAMLFSPQAGHVLVGEITEIHEDFIMCSVLGVWRAKIPASRLPEGAKIMASSKVSTDMLDSADPSSNTDGTNVNDQFVVILKEKIISTDVSESPADTPPKSKRIRSSNKSKCIMKRKSAVKFAVVRVSSFGREATHQSAGIIIEGSMR